MATTKCPECGKNVSVSHSFCSHCGASADNIRKAAAGLETLVALGGVVHGGGTVEANDIDIGTMCRRFLKDADNPEWLVQEARAGNATAMIAIGIMYQKGHKGVRRDRGQARKWYSLASEYGDSSAAEWL